VGPVFSDNDISGAKGKADRPGLAALLAGLTVKPRAFGAVVMMNDDRLSRGYIDESLALQRQIIESGVELWFYQSGTQVKLGDVTEEMMSAIKAGQARAFRVEISKKTRAALRYKAAQGHVTGAVPFGYRIVPLNGYKVFEINPEQADVVRRIFDLAAEGKGDRTIASLLTADGVPGHKSGWGRNEVARLLANEIYIGVSVWRDKAAQDEVRVTDEDRTRLGLPLLRIVTEAQWAAVRGQKSNLAATYARTPTGQLLSKPEAGFSHLLSGILRCHVCGGALGYQKKLKEQAKYRCTRRAKSPAKCSNASGIPAADVERWIRAAIVKLLHHDTTATADIIEARQARERAKVSTFGDPYADAQAEAARLEQDQAAAVASITSGAIRGELLAAVQQAFDARAAKIAALRATQPTVRPFDRTQYLDDLRTVAAKYAQLLRVDGPEVTTRAALKRLGISKLVAVPRPGSKIWDLTGRIDLEKALAEVHADDVAEPFDPDYGPADFGDVPEGGLDAAFIHSIVSPLIGSQGERAG
jgi:DNA invertase Pin-like site-specific DNA recombinase